MTTASKVHLVLGSGGMKTLGYAGAIAYLAEQGFEIASVSACSAGTVFAASLAAGVTPARLLESVRSLDMKRYVGKKAWLGPFSIFRWPRARYAKPGLMELFRDLTGADPLFRELSIPFATLGVDLLSGRILVYSTETTPDMRVSEAIRIATAIPFLYPPHVTPERVVIDGALVSECPVWLALNQPEEHPIVALLPRRERVHPKDQWWPAFIAGLAALGGTSRDLYVIQQMRRACLIEIDAQSARYDEFDLSPEKRSVLLAAGRDAAERSLGQLKTLAEGGAPEPAAPITRGEGHDAHAEFGGTRALERANGLISRQVRDRVFISYAREDRHWVDRIQVFLGATLYGKPAPIVWDDSRIPGGAEWRTEIDVALRSAKVAVLVVTSRFLASKFVRDHELKEIVRAAREDGLAIVWIHAEPSPYEKTPLEARQCANDPERPLSTLERAEVDKALLAVARQVELALA